MYLGELGLGGPLSTALSAMCSTALCLCVLIPCTDTVFCAHATPTALLPWLTKGNPVTRQAQLADSVVHAKQSRACNFSITAARRYCLQGAVCCAAASRGCQIWQVAHVPVPALQGHEGRRQHQEGGSLRQEAAADCPGAAACLHLWLLAHAVRDPQGTYHLRSLRCAVVRFLC